MHEVHKRCVLVRAIGSQEAGQSHQTDVSAFSAGSGTADIKASTMLPRENPCMHRCVEQSNNVAEHVSGTAGKGYG